MKQKDLERLTHVMYRLRQAEAVYVEWEDLLNNEDVLLSSRLDDLGDPIREEWDEETGEFRGGKELGSAVYHVYATLKVGLNGRWNELHLPSEVEFLTEKGVRAAVRIYVDELKERIEQLRSELTRANIEL